MMQTSKDGMNILRALEGKVLTAYKDIAGIWTIGYGHTGPDVKPGMTITDKEAEQLLNADLIPREKAVSELVTVALNQNEFDALVMFVYNIGRAAFAESTALKRLNAGDRAGCADAMKWWDKADLNGDGVTTKDEVSPGLANRREIEAALFLEPVRSVR
jgi:lysozyme